MKKNQNLKTMDDYVVQGKYDIYGYAILTLVFFLILLYIGYRVNWYYIIFMDLLMVGRTLERVTVYSNLKKIYKHLEELNLIDKLGVIEFWNEKHYFLTENYMIILQLGRIYVFDYSEIIKIYKKSYWQLSKYSSWEEYLFIETEENSFKILIWTNVLVGEEYKDISDYLLKKNPNIEIGLE